MTSDGYIAIAKALPRLPLYNDGRADIVILVEDNGSPPLNTTVHASISVDSKHVFIIFKVKLQCIDYPDF